MSNKRDYYEVLGVGRDAQPPDIRSAFRKLAAKYHPDVNPGDKDAEEKFKELNEAHEILSTPEKRQMYDQFGHAGPQGGMGGADGFGVGDIFDMFFGAGGGFGGRAGAGGGDRARQQATQGSDLRYDLEITLEEAAFGVQKTLKLTRLESCETCTGSGAKPGTTPKTCSACQGSGQVRHVQNTILGSFATVAPCANCRGEGRIISDPCTTCRGQGRTRQTKEHTIQVPGGVDTGTRLVDQGAGDAGLRGGQSGDLYVVVYLRPHPDFKRSGNDVLHDTSISYAQAALGAQIEVPILGGAEKLTIPAGTQPGATFKFRGKGFPDLNTRSHDKGDQIIQVKVAVPTKLSDDQKRLLREFAAASGETIQPEDGGFFDSVKKAFTHK
jgi:molecular chaperone DnaJ